MLPPPQMQTSEKANPEIQTSKFKPPNPNLQTQTSKSNPPNANLPKRKPLQTSPDPNLPSPFPPSRPRSLRVFFGGRTRLRFFFWHFFFGVGAARGADKALPAGGRGPAPQHRARRGDKGGAGSAAPAPDCIRRRLTFPGAAGTPPTCDGSPPLPAAAPPERGCAKEIQ